MFIRSFLLLWCLAELLSGCQSGSGRLWGSASNPPPDARAQALIQSGNLEGAMHRYEWLAESGADRDHWRLEAADTALRAGDPGYARRVVQTLDRRSLAPQDQNRLILIESRLDLNEGDARKALNRLDILKESSLTEADLRNDRVLRASAFNQLGDMKRSAQERMALGPLLTRPEERASNDQRIYEALSQLKPQDLGAKSGDSDEMRGWLSLTEILVNTPRAQLRQAILSWEDQYPKHPVSRAFLQEKMGKTSKETPTKPSEVPTPTLHDPYIGVLLPLEGPYAQATSAIRVGLEAAHVSDTDSRKPALQFIDTARGGLEARVREAREGGAVGLIGPLVKEDLGQILAIRDPGIRILALNQLDAVPPPSVIEFGLTPEAELDLLAAEVRAHGIRSVALLIPESAFGQRLGQHFDRIWRQQGGFILGQVAFTSRSEGLLEAVRQLPAMVEESAVVLIADPEDARRIAPHLSSLGEIPVYAASKIYDGRSHSPANAVLNGIHFCDMPFLVTPEQGGSLSGEALSPKAPEGVPDAARLVAFGVDAYRLFKATSGPVTLDQPLEGATGLLHLGASRKVLRQTTCARFDQGTPRAEALAPLPLEGPRGQP